MSDDLQPSRTTRSARVEKRWRIQAAVVLGLVAVLVVIAMLAGNSGGTPSASPAPPPTTAPSGAVQSGDLLAFSIAGARARSSRPSVAPTPVRAPRWSCHPT